MAGYSFWPDFALLAAGEVSFDSPESRIIGNVASNTPVVGLEDASIAGTVTVGASSFFDALSEATSVYDNYIAFPPSQTVTTPSIGSSTPPFPPGVIACTDPLGLVIDGNITMTGQGDHIFLVQGAIGELLTDPVTADIQIQFTNGALPSQLYWIVRGNVILRKVDMNVTKWFGNTFSRGTIVIGQGASVNGSLLGIAPATSDVHLDGSGTVTSSRNQLALEETTPNYNVLASSLADPRAIQINNTAPEGGVLVNAGLGGVNVTTLGGVSVVSSGPAGVEIRSTATELGDNAIVRIDAIGTDNPGDNAVYIGTYPSQVKVLQGNSEVKTLIVQRRGAMGLLLQTQPVPFDITTDAATLTFENLTLQIIQHSPSGGPGQLTLPTTASVGASLGTLLGLDRQVGDSITFSIINTSNLNSTSLVLPSDTPDLPALSVGNMTIAPSSSGMFRLRLTESEGAYTVYRLS